MISQIENYAALKNQEIIEGRRADGSRDKERENLSNDKISIRIDDVLFNCLRGNQDFIRLDKISVEVKGFGHTETGNYYYIEAERLEKKNDIRI